VPKVTDEGASASLLFAGTNSSWRLGHPRPGRSRVDVACVSSSETGVHRLRRSSSGALYSDTLHPPDSQPRRARHQRNQRSWLFMTDHREGHPDPRAIQNNRPKNGSVIDASPRVGPLRVSRCTSVPRRLAQGPRQWTKAGRPRSRILEMWPSWRPLHLRPGGGGGRLRLTNNFLTISA
jgi:hypothetical protein